MYARIGAAFALVGGMFCALAGAAAGDNCSQPLMITLPAQGFPYVTVNSTCGRGDDYRDTCLGDYDDGEDIIYRLTLTQDRNLRFHVVGEGLIGIALANECPPAADCRAYDTEHIDLGYVTLDVELTAGVYTLMLDTRPTPACTDFVLTIQDLGALKVGDSCRSPRVVHLPAQLPFADLGQTTCGRRDFFHDLQSCLGSFSDGEELVYQLVLAETLDLEITLDAHGQRGTGLLLHATCWPYGPQCIAFAKSLGGEPCALGCLRLAAGTYTLLVDSLELPEAGCIATLDLRVTACEVPSGACCVDSACVGEHTYQECQALGGQWHEAFECATFACPVELPDVPEACTTALTLPRVPFAIQANTNPATANGPPGSCNAPGATAMQNDLWLAYTASAAGTLTCTAVYEDYNGLMAVYGGSGCSALSELACADHSASYPDRDIVTLPVEVGQNLWIQVGDWGVNPGGGRTLVNVNLATDVRRGDLNCDGKVDFGDINPFIMILANPAGWQQQYPDCPLLNADIDGDGKVGFGDINPFVRLLTGP